MVPIKEEVKNQNMLFSLLKNRKLNTHMVYWRSNFQICSKKASAKSGISGVILLQLCEQRLDNVVFRLGISPTRRGARQLVSHRHITVNGSIVNIPSYSLKVGDVVGVREKSKSLIIISSSLSSENAVHEWLLWDNKTLAGEVKSIPTREQISENIKEQLIVELYSK